MIEIKNLCKNYGDNVIYNNFNLDISDGEVIAILGESGSGKTTLINILAGLTDYSGQIIGVGKPVSVVFQKDNLVPNLTVKENILLVNKNADADGLLNEFGLYEQRNDYIKSLSGGMARRVAIIRALAFVSGLMLLDEPFINLDLALKFKVMDIIKRHQSTNKQTIVFVTHDIKEAVYLSDRIIVLKKGEIVFDKRQERAEKLNTDRANDLNETKEKVENELFNLMLNIGNKF